MGYKACLEGYSVPYKRVQPSCAKWSQPKGTAVIKK
ncbi:hypothetical protein DFAR_3710041 [Desulfarculales bacterium]